MNNCSGSSGTFCSEHAPITYKQTVCPLCVALAELHRVKTIVWDFAKRQYERAERNGKRASELEVELIELREHQDKHCSGDLCKLAGPQDVYGCCGCNCSSCREADEVW